MDLVVRHFDMSMTSELPEYGLGSNTFKSHNNSTEVPLLRWPPYFRQAADSVPERLLNMFFLEKKIASVGIGKIGDLLFY